MVTAAPRCARRPTSHERNGDDVAAVLRHLKIAKADVAGYSHGGDAAIRMAIQHPEMVRNLSSFPPPPSARPVSGKSSKPWKR